MGRAEIFANLAVGKEIVHDGLQLPSVSTVLNPSAVGFVYVSVNNRRSVAVIKMSKIKILN